MDGRRRLWLAAGLAVLLALVVVLAAVIAGSNRTSSGPSPSSAAVGATASSTPSATQTHAPSDADPCSGGLVQFAANDLTVDDGYDPMSVAILAFALRTVDPGASVFFTLPTAGTGTSADGQSIVLPDYAGIGEVGAAERHAA